MRYTYAYKYIFQSPRWITNVLLGMVAGFVPVVGPIVFSGYLFETVEKMRRTGEEKPNDFDLNRLGPYLMRGVWPFLVALVIGLPAGMIIGALGALCIFGSVAIFAGSNPEMVPVGVGVGYVTMIVLAFVLGIFLSLVMIPMTIRAAYSMDFASAFDMAFVKDFIRKVGKETIFSQIFLTVSSIGVVIVGLLACCVGVYFVAPMIHFAQYHLIYQLLVLYEERGGMPVSFKEYESRPA
jgi:hypothetical protein